MSMQIKVFEVGECKPWFLRVINVRLLSLNSLDDKFIDCLSYLIFPFRLQIQAENCHETKSVSNVHLLAA